MSLRFSQWHKLPINLSELCINTVLRCGQSFRWQQLPDTGEWRCVLYGRLISLKQDPSYLYYRTALPNSQTQTTALPTPPASTVISRSESESATPDRDHADDTDSDVLPIIKHYFALSVNLTELYSQWSSADPNFKKKAPKFTGIRILRQDAWETLICFICSSNNNIARISQMVEKLCVNFGKKIGTVDGRAYHDFPTPEALTGDNVETRLRELGFGYRAKFIHQTAVTVAKEREPGWLYTLENPESPAFGVDPAPGEEMCFQGREGYRRAHEKLLELQGVGPKVADCVCLMGLGWSEAVPVDTHVWQIAQRDYKFGKDRNKSLTKATYDALGNYFRQVWGKEAGWAHSVLFTADLRAFSEKHTTKVEVELKEEKDRSGQIKSKVSTVTAKRVLEEDDKDAARETKTVKKEESVVQTVETRVTRRRSSRFQK